MVFFNSKAKASASWLRSVRDNVQHVWQLLGVAAYFYALLTLKGKQFNFPTLNIVGSTQVVPLLIMKMIVHSQT